MKLKYILLFLTFVIIFSCKKGSTTAQPDNEIWLLYKRFNPTFITIKKGTTLKFVNKDNANHSINETNRVFNSGKITTGSQYQYTFNDTLQHTVYCSYHPDNLQEQVYIVVTSK